MKDFYPREEKGKIVSVGYSEDKGVLSELEMEAKTQLDEYLRGNRKRFTFPIEIRGTEFQKKVYFEAIKIPYGEVITYQELATRIGMPKAARAVGNALNKNPLTIVVPCHRIVGVKGLTGYELGLDVKARLLKLEGVNIES